MCKVFSICFKGNVRFPFIISKRKIQGSINRWEGPFFSILLRIIRSILVGWVENRTLPQSVTNGKLT